MMNRFAETHPEFKGFSEYYECTILPDLEAQEFERKRAVRNISVNAPIIIGTGLALTYLVWTFFPIIPLILFLCAASFMAAFGYAAYRLKDVKSATKNRIVAGVCDYIGWEFSEDVTEPPDLAPLIDYGLLPSSYNRVNFEDKISGNAHGTDFETLECHMEKRVKTKNGERWDTVFRGSLMAIDFHQKFLGKTVVLRDKGFFNAKTKHGLKRVGLVDPVFEKIFEAYSTDQVESRYLLTPTFMQRLVDIETSIDGKNIRFAFLDGLLLAAVETSNRFESGSMFSPLVDTARTQKILDEVGAVYNLVDGAMKPQTMRKR
ncbi:MAG: DUF3137 domain-containing protein [Alphaproteobacteria bacterium]